MRSLNDQLKIQEVWEAVKYHSTLARETPSGGYPFVAWGQQQEYFHLSAERSRATFVRTHVCKAVRTCGSFQIWLQTFAEFTDRLDDPKNVGHLLLAVDWTCTVIQRGCPPYRDHAICISCGLCMGGFSDLPWDLPVLSQCACLRAYSRLNVLGLLASYQTCSNRLLCVENTLQLERA